MTPILTVTLLRGLLDGLIGTLCISHSRLLIPQAETPGGIPQLWELGLIFHCCDIKAVDFKEAQGMLVKVWLYILIVRLSILSQKLATQPQAVFSTCKLNI
jgi:hypothetical protein